MSEEKERKEAGREKEKYKSEHYLKTRIYHLLSILTTKTK